MASVLSPETGYAILSLIGNTFGSGQKLLSTIPQYRCSLIRNTFGSVLKLSNTISEYRCTLSKRMVKMIKNYLSTGT